MKSRILAAGAAVALMAAAILGGATAASATTEYPDGGTWIYGVFSGGEWGTGETVVSDYLHPSKTHRSTACSNSACTYAPWTARTYWSVAHHYGASLWGNTAYYDYI